MPEPKDSKDYTPAIILIAIFMLAIGIILLLLYENHLIFKP
jgi:hypothetical protein